MRLTTRYAIIFAASFVCDLIGFAAMLIPRGSVAVGVGFIVICNVTILALGTWWCD